MNNPIPPTFIFLSIPLSSSLSLSADRSTPSSSARSDAMSDRSDASRSLSSGLSEASSFWRAAEVDSRSSRREAASLEMVYYV